jgi:hypothetical protein
MQEKIKEIEINGVTYVERGQEQERPLRPENYVIVRTRNAGVFAGEIAHKFESDQRVILNQCRRIWYWDGAASLSQLAIDGVSKPENCKFTVRTDDHEIFEVIEIIPCTLKAMDSIEGVDEWKM